jgi:hypothetical protein
MDRQDVYGKTEKGLEEIKSRKYNVPQAMRSLLIMIDGTKTVGSFLDQAGALGDVSAMLAGLEQQGFIVKAVVAAKPTAAADKKAASAPEKGKAPVTGGGGLVDVASMFTIPGGGEEEGEEEEK